MSPHGRLRLFLLLLAALGGILSSEASGMERLRYQRYPHLEGKPVRQILILGNEHTREIVFRREMNLTEGVPFRSELLWKDWENLVDLGIFANIEVDAVPSGDGVLVVICVFERPRWFFAPVADYSFSRAELSVGYRLRLRNLAGMNQSFFSDGKVGARGAVRFVWSTPWLGTRRRTLSVGLEAQLPQEDVDELRTNQLFLSTTKFLGDYRRLRRGVTYFGRLAIIERDGTSPHGPVEQLSPSFGAGYFRDSRNVRIDPHRGSLLSLHAEYAGGWTTDDLSYLRGSGDARMFVPVGRGVVLAGRLVSVITTGEVPDYRRVAVGGANSLRGQPGGVLVGDNLARGSLELRFPLFAQRRFNLPIPFAPRRVRNFDLRFDGVLFVDAGTAWSEPLDLRDVPVKAGFGLGVRIFLPVLEVARFEVAFGPDGEPTLYLREGNLI